MPKACALITPPAVFLHLAPILLQVSRWYPTNFSSYRRQNEVRTVPQPCARAKADDHSIKRLIQRRSSPSPIPLFSAVIQCEKYAHQVRSVLSALSFITKISKLPAPHWCIPGTRLLQSFFQRQAAARSHAYSGPPPPPPSTRQ